MFKMRFALALSFVFNNIDLTVCNSIPSKDVLNAKTVDELRTKEISSKVHQSTRRRLDGHIEKSESIVADHFGGVPGFYHGVASGDPLTDRVILWTRYTPVKSLDNVELELRIAEVDSSIPFGSLLDIKSNPSIKVAKMSVGPSTDYVAKVDVVGLKSNTHYVYAFMSGSTVSEIGQTRTAPREDDDTEDMTYAFFSCSHFSNGYFHAYDVASTIKNLDFWIHVGDYIYEYGAYDTYASDATERKEITLPFWEIIDVQDYRNRYATYHLDEGLRNLRRRAPVIQIWDDHEITNNAYGEGDVSNSGAENHQSVCKANSTSPDAEKEAAKCDRDEGDIKSRFTNAAQAYMEWMPLRRGKGTMGIVDITSITQIIEWGSLASIVAVDTRMTDRSKEPTLASAFNDFAGAAFGASNVSEYYDENSEIRRTFDEIANKTKMDMWDPSFSQIGDENIALIMDVFEKSKSENKPWQIWAGATMMGPQKPINLDKLWEHAPEEVAPAVKQYMDAVLADDGSFFFRGVVAMDITETPWNRDGFDGFAHERAKILDGFKENSNNPIALGGDLHDSWAWTLYEGGKMDGIPVAVNLGCPGVTSPGWGPFLSGLVAPLADGLGGPDGVGKLLADTFAARNTGLVYADVSKKGFVAVKATKEHHIAEYILFEPETILSDYNIARNASKGITASFTCATSLVTTADEKGSLIPQDECIIEYDDSRPALWDIHVPQSGTEESGDMILSNCGYNPCVFEVPKIADNESFETSGGTFFDSAIAGLTIAIVVFSLF